MKKNVNITSNISQIKENMKISNLIENKSSNNSNANVNKLNSSKKILDKLSNGIFGNSNLSKIDEVFETVKDKYSSNNKIISKFNQTGMSTANNTRSNFNTGYTTKFNTNTNWVKDVNNEKLNTLNSKSSSKTDVKKNLFQNINIRDPNIISILEDVIKIRKLMRDDYKKVSNKAASKYKEIISLKWREIISLIIQVDVRFAINCIKILGDIYMEFDDYEKAKNCYNFFKFIALNLELLEELMIAYECLGNVYKFMYKHEKSIIFFKKEIEAAWILNNKVFELRAYDNIGIQYFYLGNKMRAKYYHLRFICGRTEKEGEIMKKCKKEFTEKNFNFFEGDKYKNKVISNSYLKIKLKELLNMFDGNKDLILEEIDMGKIPESINNSNVSRSNVTFNIISKLMFIIKLRNI